METGRQDGGSDKNHAPFSVGKTGNISRKFLTIILKIFDKNFERLHRANNKPIFVKLKGLDASAKYRLEDGRVISGSALMNAGISIPSVSGEFRAIQFELKAEE